MTGVNGFSAYADLLPTSQELADLEAVIQEVLAGELAGELPDGDEDLDEDGPWRDELANLDTAGHAIDLSVYAEQARQAEDSLPLPQRSEDRLAWLMGRAERGTYTLSNYYRPAEPEYGCGIIDQVTGRCAARYHQGHCLEVARGEIGSTEMAERWVQTLLSNAGTAAELSAARASLDADDLFGDETGDQDTLSRARQLLGITKPGLPARPAISPLSAQGLGIW